MTDYAELVGRLRKIESDPIGGGLAHNWHRNPDGPKAADAITALRDEVEGFRGCLATASGELMVAQSEAATLRERVRVLEALCAQ